VISLPVQGEFVQYGAYSAVLQEAI
jgi:hypothetical protein